MERATRLAEENESLREELDRARSDREVPENLGAFQRRLLDERDELAREVDRLRERLGERASLAAQLARSERSRREASLGRLLEEAIEGLFASLRTYLRRQK